jgi:endonuclease YncB( thermonuclease family)
VRIRLLGVAEPEDDQAKALLDQELQSQVGKSLLVRLDLPRRRGPDGAVQAYLWLSERQMLNQMLVQEGWALANDSEPFIYQGTFAAGQQEARQKRAGIWSLNAEPPTHHGGHRRRAAGLSAE